MSIGIKIVIGNLGKLNRPSAEAKESALTGLPTWRAGLVNDLALEMAKVGSVTNATAAELCRLEAAARKHAAASGFSARTIARDQYCRACAGLSVAQIMAAQEARFAA